MLVSRIASGIDQNKFRSTVGLFDPGWLQTRMQGLALQVTVMPMRSQWDVSWISRCIRLVRHAQVRAIHAHEFRANVFGAVVARLCGIPIVTTVHGKSYYPDQLKRRIAYRWVSRRSHMVAVSHDLRRFLADRIGIPQDRVAVIHNGVDPVDVSVLDQRPLLRQEWGVDGQDCVFGIVGSLYEVKGHRFLFQAFQHVVRRYVSAKLIVVGQGRLGETLKQQVKDLGIERNVLFLGLRSDVPRILSAVDVFVLPSLSEGLSVALCEAMVAGLPVVASQVGGNQEVVVEAETGYLIPAGDVERLTDRLLHFAEQPDDRRICGQRGRERILQHFSTEQMLRQYERLYEFNQ